MAKSKSGGSRSYLRGKLGADVYSIGKDGKGKKQQVVRALAETVANPQTQAQMRGRMIMSTVMQAQSALSQIIDHSFDGVPAGQPSISQFIRLNYALVKADVAAHPTSGNAFGCVKYGEKGAKLGLYQISDGKASLPSTVKYDTSGGTFTLGTFSASATVGDLLDSIGLGENDYLTLVTIKADGSAAFVRLRVKAGVDTTAVLSQETLAGTFNFEGTDEPTFTYSSYKTGVVIGAGNDNGAVIVSRATADGYSHNKAVFVTNLQPGTYPSYAADVALPTYPVGNAKFLNGGDIPGLDQG